MKLSKKQLKKIITEEIQNVLQEQEPSTPVTFHPQLVPYYKEVFKSTKTQMESKNYKGTYKILTAVIKALHTQREMGDEAAKKNLAKIREGLWTMNNMFPKAPGFIKIHLVGLYQLSKENQP